uniref:Replication protein A 70 kDa DNA-binding subunit B/D first OB fold domain-containing protein n=1 Tax=Setaria viridis TaxID=4556 RepID=A0A4U6VH88_SETVI|nr:hypothetical protein SEVIR_3G357300v2 [Setaria viridis]
MACKTLSQVKPGKELWKIKVWVTRQWDAILLGSGEQLSLDMILINQEETMMHGVINKAYMEKFKPLIQENNVYIIANVKVKTAAKKYQPVENDKVANFLPITTLKKIKDKEDIPNVLGVAAHIGPIEEIRTSYGLSKTRDIILLIE